MWGGAGAKSKGKVPLRMEEGVPGEGTPGNGGSVRATCAAQPCSACPRIPAVPLALCRLMLGVW